MERKGYYQVTVEEISDALVSRFPEIVPDPEGKDTNLSGYIFWMINEISGMDVSSVQHSYKAAR